MIPGKELKFGGLPLSAAPGFCDKHVQTKAVTAGDFHSGQMFGSGYLFTFKCQMFTGDFTVRWPQH